MLALCCHSQQLLLVSPALTPTALPRRVAAAGHALWPRPRPRLLRQQGHLGCGLIPGGHQQLCWCRLLSFSSAAHRASRHLATRARGVPSRLTPGVALPHALCLSGPSGRPPPLPDVCVAPPCGMIPNPATPALPPPPKQTRPTPALPAPLQYQYLVSRARQDPPPKPLQHKRNPANSPAPAVGSAAANLCPRTTALLPAPHPLNSCCMTGPCRGRRPALPRALRPSIVCDFF